MDAFAVAICKGLAMKKISLKKSAIVGLWFGVFQAGMPLIGYFLCSRFEKYIVNFDHWIAFGLLFLIGANMIREAIIGDEEDTDASIGIKTMFLMAVATSIDALAIGVTFASIHQENIFFSVSLIGVTTFILSAIGVKVGNVFGTKFKAKAEISGGIILILLGVKILVQHLS